MTTELATSTTTARTPVYTGTPCGTQPYGALWYGFRGDSFKLYCSGASIAGRVLEAFYHDVTDMSACLGLCYDYRCTAATFGDDGTCLLYSGSVTLQASGNLQVAISVSGGISIGGP